MKDKIKINLETGLMVEVVHPSVFGDDIIETPCDYPFYLPKWDGEKWVEAGQAPETTPQEPTELELLMLAVAELADIVMGG